jgi:hypothetical protein
MLLSDSTVAGLVSQAKAMADRNDRMSLWRAYVAIEHAILDVKLRYHLEGEPPPKPAKKADLAAAKLMLEQIDLSSDKKKLLYDLRACRDLLKALVAGYDRRSTTS